MTAGSFEAAADGRGRLPSEHGAPPAAPSAECSAASIATVVLDGDGKQQDFARSNEKTDMRWFVAELIYNSS